MTHCAGCADATDPAFACERYGGKGACPEDDHAPKSCEGRGFVSAVGAISSQIRAGFGGFIGLDIAACIPVLAAQGVDARIAALLLPAWEQGMIRAANDARKEKGET